MLTVQLNSFKWLRAEGNTDIQFVSTGRMHNRAVRMMLTLPIIAETVGINAEDACHIPEARFKELLENSFTSDHRDHLIDELTSGDQAPNHEALKKLLIEYELITSEDNLSAFFARASNKQLRAAADAIFTEYKRYPRMSVSRLMAERAHQEGVPLEAIHEEDGAVDTISNLVFVTELLEELDAKNKKATKRVVIVAGSDHLPRTAWIADHILPDGIEITFVESDAALSKEEYATSCTRERLSFLKGSGWIGGTRDIEELREIVERGYFSKERPDATELAQQVAAQAGKTAIKNL